MDKIPVFDNWGNHVGDFIPSGTSGLACLGYALLGIVFFALSPCFLPFMLVVGIGYLFWAYNQTNNPKRKTHMTIAVIMLLVSFSCIFVSFMTTAAAAIQSWIYQLYQ